MKKFLFLSLFTLASTATTQAQETENQQAVKQSFRLLTVEDMMKPIEPQFLQNYIHTGGFCDNWFVGIAGGINALSGSPLGCGDLFDRFNFSFHAHAGKWINPNVGVRLALQGFKFKDMNMDSKSFQAYHADFMYNLSSLFRKPTEELPRWDLAPYVGFGFAHGRDISYIEEDGNLATASNYPFILAYGFNVKYRISKNIHLMGEVGAFTTFANFDGFGKNSHFKDNLLSASIGVAFTFNPGWKHAINTNNYIAQNNYLANYCNELMDKNKQLLNDLNVNENIIKQLRKILEVEGLLDKYDYIFKDKGANNKNNYKGLLSLRARIREMQNNDTFNAGMNDAFKMEEDSDNGMSVPIYFFFKLGTSTLTDNSQLVNLRELAKVVNKHGLHIKIEGAADAETGTASINNNLSSERASFIAKELIKLGVSDSFIGFTGKGGIREFEKPEQNRYARVAIILDLNK